MLSSRFKDVSFSFRADCMPDVSTVMCSVLRNKVVLHALHGYTVKTEIFGNVEAVLVFRFYEGFYAAFIHSVMFTLAIIGDLNGDQVTIAGSINFTDDYDGTLYTRCDWMERLEKKIADAPFKSFEDD